MGRWFARRKSAWYWFCPAAVFFIIFLAARVPAALSLSSHSRSPGKLAPSLAPSRVKFAYEPEASTRRVGSHISSSGQYPRNRTRSCIRRPTNPRILGPASVKVGHRRPGWPWPRTRPHLAKMVESMWRVSWQIVLYEPLIEFVL